MEPNDERPVLQIHAGSTPDGDVKLDFYHGPVMSSIILSVVDEDSIVALLDKAFTDAKRVLAGETLEDIANDNREGHNGTLHIVQ